MYHAQEIRDAHLLFSRLKGSKADDGTDMDDDGNTNYTIRMMNSDKQELTLTSLPWILP